MVAANRLVPAVPDMSLLSIDATASEKARALLGRAGKTVLRLSVIDSGCAGLSYQFTPEDAPAASDVVFEADGFKVVVDRKLFLSVAGSEITYEEGGASSGFRVNNPNGQGCGSCNSQGCGSKSGGR